MYKKIMVPLDGSKLAKCVLPHVEAIAKGAGAEKVFLVSVTEWVQGFRPVDDSSQPLGESMMPETAGKMEQLAQKYLDRIAEDLKAKGINVETLVLIGDPADELVLNAKNYGADLIIMASHGRSGVRKWTHGSVAEKVFRASQVPVLMVRAPVQ